MVTLSEVRERAAQAPPGAPPAPVGPSVFAAMVDDVRAESDAGLVERFRELDAALRRLEAEIAVVVGVVDERKVWAADAHTSVLGWMRSTGNWSTRHALAARKRARLFDLAPDAGEALMDGRCGVAQTDEMARAAANPRCGTEIVDVVPTLVDVGPKVSFEEFRTIVRRWETLADADGAHRDRDETERRRRASLHIADGVVHLSATGGVLAGAEMEAILDAFVRAELLTDRDAAVDGVLPRTDAQRRFDALHQIFLAAASTPADAQRPEPSVHLAIDAGTWLEHLARLRVIELAPRYQPPDLLDRWCQTSRGHALTPADALAAALVGTTRRIVFGRDGVVIDLGRRSRLFRGGAADAVRWHSTRCTQRGCDRPQSWTEHDHLVPWEHHGETNPANGAPACRHHNRARQRGYRVHRDDDGHWHTHRPDGTEIT